MSNDTYTNKLFGIPLISHFDVESQEESSHENADGCHEARMVKKNEKSEAILVSYLVSGWQVSTLWIKGEAVKVLYLLP